MRLKNKIPAALLSISLISTAQTTFAQNNINRNVHDVQLLHGIQQYEDGHYVQAIHSLEGYLNMDPLSMILDKKILTPNLDRDRALYYLILSKIKYGTDDMEQIAKSYIENEVNTVFRDRVSYQLAKHYFLKKDYEAAVYYYEIIDIKNLNNDEIAELKFEQAYSYFVNSEFDKAYPLFASIKEVESGPYFHPGNYYYGILAYNKKQYDQALLSFRRIEKLDDYSHIVPYYIFEIYYFQNEYDKIIQEVPAYLNAEEKLYYHNELSLLLGKVHYDRKEYESALPYFKTYYDNTEKIRKENLYEYAFTNYSLGHFNQAIDLFKPLSNTNDSLGQNSMYLLGDSYLKIQDKNGAKNAFFLAQNMDFIPSIKEASQFLYAKLSYEAGDYSEALQTFNSYIQTYPSSPNVQESKELLVTILSKSKNYETAYEVLSKMNLDGTHIQSIYQQVTFHRAIQYLKSSNQQENALDFLNKSLNYPINKDIQAAALFWRSYVLYDMKDFKQSESDIQNYLSIVKNNDKNVTSISKEASIKNAQVHLGYVQMSLEKYADAQKNFAAAGNTNSSSPSENYLLQADAAFMAKKYNEADDLYSKALTGSENPSYILFQKASIAGIENRNDDKVALLNRIIKEYPNASIIHQTEFELASTLIVMDKMDMAIPILKRLITIENKDIAAKSMLQLAYAYQKKNDAKNTIETYELFIKSFPNHPDKEQHLETLYAMYISQQNPKGYHDFLKNNNIQTSVEVSEEQAYFDIGENKYLNDDYTGAIETFIHFLKDFPNSPLTTRVDYYLAEAYSKTYRFTDAKYHYEKLLNSSDEGMKETAILNLAKLENINEDYFKSDEYLDLYQKYENRNNYSNELLMLELDNLNHLDQFNEFEPILQILEERDGLSEEDKTKLELYNANSELHFNPNEKYINVYNRLAGHKNGEIAAEARVRKAELLLRLGKVKEAEQAADFAIEKNGDYNFWLVKSYIVITDVLAAQDDFISARATIQSVINNVKNPVLKYQADEMLKKVNELEESKSNLINED